MISPLRPGRAGRSTHPSATPITAKPERFKKRYSSPWGAQGRVRSPSRSAFGFIAALIAFLLTPEPQAAGVLAPEPIIAGVRVFYGPGDGFGTIDERLIDGARRTIDLAGFVLTDRGVINALARAGARGVRVRVYLDGEESPRGGGALAALATAPNVEVRRKAATRDYMHLKSFQIDGRLVRTGSANFSFSAGSYQDNDLIVLESPQAAHRFLTAFDRLWARPDNQRIGVK
jgi:phosphatidylserine/phosphatidylglycerophosphate/cardiolipin synthase-like enzyme